MLNLFIVFLRIQIKNIYIYFIFLNYFYIHFRNHKSYLFTNFIYIQFLSISLIIVWVTVEDKQCDFLLIKKLISVQ